MWEWKVEKTKLMNSMVGRSGSLIQLPKRTEVSSLVINLFNKLISLSLDQSLSWTSDYFHMLWQALFSIFCNLFGNFSGHTYKMNV